MTTAILSAGGFTRSLSEVHSTVPISPRSFWRRLYAFSGPAYLVSVGYMDPGNWGTDLQAGAAYRYGLLWVVAAASAIAILMQVCSAKLGIVVGRDLAQCCRQFYPGWTRWPNWIACELAIAACDLAEVLGSALAINLLFGIPLFGAVLITAFDVLLLLGLQGVGIRLIEALILVLVATIGSCYFVEIFVLPATHPDFGAMAQAVARPGLREEGMALLAIAIIGATVMPHNLYLHSALVQTRCHGREPAAIKQAIRFNTFDTVLALSLAFLVNAAILILAAEVFNGKSTIKLPDGEVVPLNDDTDWIRSAHLTLAPIMGTAAASFLFALALLASGQSSTITGTLAGQVVMEGFMSWRIRPWVRRLVTRAVAIVPAIAVIGWHGDGSVTELLVISQVVLALQLPFAMFPLLHFTGSRRRMGEFANGWTLKTITWICFALVVGLSIFGVLSSMGISFGSPSK